MLLEVRVSNRQALELFVRYRPSYMSHLLLAHLSQDNNRPELAQALFEEESGGTHIVVASGYNLTILVRLARRLFEKRSFGQPTFSDRLITCLQEVEGQADTRQLGGRLAHWSRHAG